jgi:hypothetical protein
VLFPESIHVPDPALVMLVASWPLVPNTLSPILPLISPVPGLVPQAPSNRDFANGFAGELMLKDLRLALDAIHAVGMTPALALKSEEIYSEYIVKYRPNRDFSGVIDMLRNK